MVQKDNIEAILKINGVTPTAPDEEIRSVLLSARYSKDEVDTAIMILRENVITKETRVDGLHKIFHSDERLKASEISQLLGIEVELSDTPMQIRRSRDLTRVQYVIVWVMAVAVALGGIAYYMYLNQVGVFHPSAGIDWKK